MSEIIQREDLAKTDFSDISSGVPIGPVHPGMVLSEDFMAPRGLSGRALAAELGVPSNRVTEIVRGERAITAETAIRLADFFGTTAEFWMNLQVAHDLEQARAAMGEAAQGSTSGSRWKGGRGEAA